MNIICILGNQLFDLKYLPEKPNDQLTIFMREDRELCTHFKYHKHKIIFFLAAMRKYAEELKSAGYKVHYEKLGSDHLAYEDSLLKFLKKAKTQKLYYFEIEDKFFEKRLLALAVENKIQHTVLESPMFLTTRDQFSKMVNKNKKPFMKTFYEAQRKRLKILINAKGEPEGGQWSFDQDNRVALPKNHHVPEIPKYKMDQIDLEVARLVEKEFSDHPGRADQFWLPTDRTQAKEWAKDFFIQRFENFGPYEDALSKTEAFVYHSVLTPYLNTGLLTPKEIVATALKVRVSRKIPMNSAEGFIRQIIGWREFVRGIYQNYSEIQDEKNFFNHQRKLTDDWYNGTTGIEPLDDVIKKTVQFGYAHHIERLMVVGSLMLLLEIHPHEAHKWFMEMFIDSSDWVMGPNVYGMALFSDGGIFATKPYFCGSNYYKKMGRYTDAGWCSEVDGLYWTFVDKHRTFFAKNPRLSMMVKTFDKFSDEKKNELKKGAQKVKARITN